MRRETIIKSKSLGGTSDLTISAPIKPGFAPSLESITYKTRVKRVLETLHNARQMSHEYALSRLLSDAVERVGAIHSVRVAVLEPENKVLLVVTFDGNWESYVRVLWDKVGPLLDVIFCSTVDYVTALDHSYEEWVAWVRHAQIETGFFYGPPEATARDVLFQKRSERVRNGGDSTEASELRIVIPSAEGSVDAFLGKATDSSPGTSVESSNVFRIGLEQMRSGLHSLAGIYGLVDLFLPESSDGRILRAAAICLLKEFVDTWNSSFLEKEFEEARGSTAQPGRFRRQLSWLIPNENDHQVGVKRPQPEISPIPPAVYKDIQGGIVSTYSLVTHGLLICLYFESSAAVSHFLKYVEKTLTHGDVDHEAQPGSRFANLYFTSQGLRISGLSETTLNAFPEDFKQGMATRAGLLGDVRYNHPQRWHLPASFIDIDSKESGKPVDIGTVHAVLQVRCRTDLEAELATNDIWEPSHPLRPYLSDLVRFCTQHGTQVLALQPLKRHFNALDGNDAFVEHFGFRDGLSDPVVGGEVDRNNQVHLGEVLLGHANAADAADLEDPSNPEWVQRKKFLKNGSFLVVRKYRQYVERLENVVGQTVSTMLESGQENDENKKKALAEVVYSKLMGRGRDGSPLTPKEFPDDLNDFDFESDPNGNKCPLHSHIRRANARIPVANENPLSRPPRIIRRSMSYGPKKDSFAVDGDVDRGSVFMAYNASLSEQFEVIQRWLVGANSSGASSSPSCPIVGVAENGFAKHYRFLYEDGGIEKIANVALEPNKKDFFDEREAITRLEWGMYLFAPSLTALKNIEQVALAASHAKCPMNLPWNGRQGRETISRLRAIEITEGGASAKEAWKAAIEDSHAIDRLENAALWSAIREDHDGILRTPYGVLVANRELVSQVYLDKDQLYSVSGQYERLRNSIGSLYLGLDAGEQYDQESKGINDALMAESPAKAFDVCRKAANAKIDAMIADEMRHAIVGGDTKLELRFDAREILDEALASLTEYWFGIQGSEFFTRGGTDLSWSTTECPRYPGHFTAPSRYMFQPNPGDAVIARGELYGQALNAAMLKFVQKHLTDKTTPVNAEGLEAPIAKAVFSHPAASGANGAVFVANTMAGIIMGYTPTIIGAVLNVLKEWHLESKFQYLRAVGLQDSSDFKSAASLLFEPMSAATQMRPMPQITWRTARKSHRLGLPGLQHLDIAVGERIILSIVSATQQSLIDGEPHHLLNFGGDRSVKPHPTHACPGYSTGIAAMLGTITALITRAEDMRHGATAFGFEITKAVPKARVRTEEKVRADVGRFQAMLSDDPTRLDWSTKVIKGSASKGLILAWGDSWVDNPWVLFGFKEPGTGDLVQSLKKLGYVVNTEGTDNKQWCNYRTWLNISNVYDQLAANPEPKPRFRGFLREKLKSKPVAIFLSGGGNDTVKEKLKTMINPKGHADGPINRDGLKSHLALLLKYYEFIVDEIQRVLKESGQSVPIIVHGYDFPIPFYTSAFGGQQEWMQRPLIDLGYYIQTPDQSKVADIKAGSMIMSELIRALNNTLETRLATTARPYVHYLNLTGTVPPNWGNPSKAGWRDNMHPNELAFDRLAARLSQAIGLIKLPI